MLAITHAPSSRMQYCLRTFVDETDIDHELAIRQHKLYCKTLEDCGLETITLNVNDDFPDSTFIEDTAIVLDEVIVLSSMGNASRQAEPARLQLELSRYREIRRIKPPATIEGGDVLRLGRELLVGLSPRTNVQGLAALESIVRVFGYRVTPVPVSGCLHLKTACTALPDHRLLINPAWVDAHVLRPHHVIAIPESEPWAANVLPMNHQVVMARAHLQTGEMVQGLGFDVRGVDVSEFAKAEGGVTCLSLLVRTAC